MNMASWTKLWSLRMTTSNLPQGAYGLGQQMEAQKILGYGTEVIFLINNNTGGCMKKKKKPWHYVKQRSQSKKHKI